MKKSKRDNSKERRQERLDIQSTMQAERTKRFQAQTKWQELKIAKEEGRLVDRDMIIREQYQREMRIKKAFMVLGREIASQLVGKGAIEMEAIITEKCCEIMRELAQTKP